MTFTAGVRWVDPPPQTLPSDQSIISCVKLFLNNEKKPQMNGLVRIPNREGSIQRTSAVRTMGRNEVKAASLAVCCRGGGAAPPSTPISLALSALTSTQTKPVHRVKTKTCRRKCTISLSGNRTPVTRVTGGYTGHYTNKDRSCEGRAVRSLQNHRSCHA